jgi:hypothetical protein
MGTERVVKAAELVRNVLKTVGFRSWVKTTGGPRLHVVVSLKGKRSVTECLDFLRAVSEAIATRDPRSYTTAFAKVGRERHILVAYLRNNRTNTSVRAFSAGRGSVNAARVDIGKVLKSFRPIRPARSRNVVEVSNAIQESGAAAEVCPTACGRENLQPDVRRMEPRDRWQELAGARRQQDKGVETKKVATPKTSHEEVTSMSCFARGETESAGTCVKTTTGIARAIAQKPFSLQSRFWF